jgi:hypothetical protein
MQGGTVNRKRLTWTLGAALVAALGVGTFATARDNQRRFDERLTGYEEVPALSTSGIGRFTARVGKDESEIRWELSFSPLESDVTQAHIHFENATNNGPVIVFLCSNLGNGPEGTQACPAAGGTVSGTIHDTDVGGGGADQGLEAGNLAELIGAMRGGATYVNVHSSGRPTGEIRAQLGDHHHG